MDLFDFALITGGAGFNGSHIPDRLVEDTENTVYDDLSAGNADHVPEEESMIQNTVRDADRLTDSVADVDVVFH